MMEKEDKDIKAGKKDDIKELGVKYDAKDMHVYEVTPATIYF